MLKRKALLVAVLCSVFSLCPLLYSQANGSLSGTVADKTGSVITGATVKITSQGTGLTREVKTDASGHYLAPLLPVAHYTIRVESQGFQTTEQKDIRLQVDEHLEIDFSLNPASVSQTVEVNATEVAVETANPTLGQVITSEEVADLPLNGRNFVQLATLTPGTSASTSPVSFFTNAASSEAATRGSFSLSVGGSREQSTDWLLDGNDNNQLDEGGIGIFSSIDDIQEFKVLTYNYSAEYGERAGPTVLVTTKSGTNQWHGTLFEFFRNTSLDAKTPFINKAAKFNLNQFGGSLGGPIQKDKTFFFIDYQAKMQRRGVPFTGFVPTTAMVTPDANGNYDFSSNPFGTQLTNPYANQNKKTGEPTNFQCVGNTTTPEPVQADGSQPAGTPCSIIPAALITHAGAGVAALYPAPNVSGNSGFNYANQPVRRLNEGTWDIRFDHNFSSKDSAFARFSYDQATNFVPGGSPTWSEQNAFGSNQHIENHGRNLALSETHVFSATTINQVNAGYNRIFNHINSFGTGTCEAAKLGIPGADLGAACDSITGYPASLNQSPKDCESCGLTSFLMGSYFAIGDRGYSPYQGGTNVYSVSDTLDLIRGKHDIRVGMVFRANEMNVRNNAFQDGFVVDDGTQTGDDIADLLLGSMGVFAAHDQTFLGATTGRRFKLYRPFVQDDWRVTSNLTLNIGLAWALVTPETEVNNRQANFDVTNLKWYVPAGSPAITGCTNCVITDGRVGIQFDKTALEPRIGLAWKPFGGDKTVVRAGYAIYHDSSWDQGGQGLWQNPPYYAEVDPFPTFCTTFGTPACGLSNGFLVNGSPLTSPVGPGAYTGTIQSQNRNFKQGIIQQFNLNIERQLPGNVVLTAGYAGTRSAHILTSQLNENLNEPSACPGGSNFTPGYTLGCGFGTFPYAGFFQSVDTNYSIGQARYDSLQIKAETKSVRHGLYALLGYTYSRNFDSGMPDGLGTNPGALYYPLPGSKKLDWGLSELNLNQSFTASVLYDLPFGKGKYWGSGWSSPVDAVFGHWQVDLIERATSGFPLYVVDSKDESGTFFSYNGNTFQRPNQVGDPNRAGPVAANPGCSAPSRIHTLSNWFNPCAFAFAPAGELGTGVRAPIYGPRFVNTDFSLIKDFPLSFREGMNLQFRAEFFNVFNHPQYFLQGAGGTGEMDINTPSSFGVINNTVNNPRLIQFAFKLKF
ncbi:MAG TPA: carboxypeptidase-like regulatory domain-containing protein [Terriglobales bacterium]|nr:carboxypeptidase-like regulatory domain-containing protein [Terriglobales bacterium]